MPSLSEIYSPAGIPAGTRYLWREGPEASWLSARRESISLGSWGGNRLNKLEELLLLNTRFGGDTRLDSGPWIGRMRRALVVMMMMLTGGTGRAAASHEYQLKSVFLFNFARFVDWPETAFADARAPLIIGVLGEDPFGPALDDTVRNETIDGRKLEVRRYARAEEIRDCHVLFISQSESSRIAEHVAALRNRSVLTVSDLPGSALKGVMIRLITEQNRIRLRINLEEAKAAHLIISSKLLRPAEIVTTQKD